jgi:hypothetical protein
VNPQAEVRVCIHTGEDEECETVALSGTLTVTPTQSDADAAVVILVGCEEQ